MSENIEQAVREVARFLANDPTNVTGQNIRHARIIVAIVERNLIPLAPDVATVCPEHGEPVSNLIHFACGCSQEPPRQ